MIDVYLEKAKGGCMAHLFSHLGCVARARSITDLDKAVGKALERYAELGDRWNFPVVPVRPSTKIRIIEEVSGKPVWQSGNPATLFEPDLEPLTPEVVEAGFGIMRGLRAELLDRVQELEQDHLEAKLNPKRRSIGETLEHLADCQWWYLSRIDDDLPYWEDKCPGELFPRLVWLLNKAQDYLRELPIERRALVYVPSRHPTADPRERWTPRKVLRRLLEHEFEHLGFIDRDISAAKRMVGKSRG